MANFSNGFWGTVKGQNTVSSLIVTNTGYRPFITQGGVTKDRTLGFSGTVMSGTTVGVYDGTKLLGYATIKNNKWFYDTPALIDGIHDLKFEFKDTSKNTVQNLIYNRVTIDTIAPKAVLSSKSPSIAIKLENNISETEVSFSGTTEPYSAITVYDNNYFIGRIIDSNNTWQFSTTKLLAGTTHNFTFEVMDAAGNITYLKSDNFKIPTQATTPNHVWSKYSGWGIVNVLSATNLAIGKNLADKPTYENSWGLNKHNIADMWAYGYTGKGIKIAIIDTGMTKNKDMPSIDPKSYDFVNNDSDVTDDNGHGTFVASEIGALNNGIGITGAAYGANLLILKAMKADGSGSSDILSTAVRYAVDNGAKIINMSLGGADDPTNYTNAVQYAKDKGVLLVIAAGNDALSKPDFPAYYANKGYKNVIAVGAIQSDATPASFSNKAGDGPYQYLSAAGVDVLGYKNDGTTNVKSLQGTSMATPLVAASAALLAGAYQDTYKTALSAEGIASYLIKTAEQAVI